MSTTSYLVTGLTCGHCVAAVGDELRSLPEVSEVTVALVAGGASTVTVSSTQPLAPEAISAALDEAGDYRLEA